MGRIAVVGITGTIGGRVASRAVAAGHEVRGLARHPKDVPPEMEAVAVDLTDRTAAVRALDGMDGLYLTPPLAGPDPEGTERAVAMNVIGAAAELGLEHVVMHTAVHADRGDTGSRILDNKTPLEAALADSGLGYTILRPAWYLQNLHGAKGYLEQGMFSLPWPADMVWAATDVEDVARAAVWFLGAGPANRGFDIHLPGGVTSAAICRSVERVTETAVSYYEAPSTREAVEPYPITDIHKELYAELFDYFKSATYLGDPEPITAVVNGFEYGSIEDFLRRELFSEVTA